MKNRDKLKGILNGDSTALERLKKNVPPIHAMLQVVAPEGYAASGEVLGRVQGIGVPEKQGSK